MVACCPHGDTNCVYPKFKRYKLCAESSYEAYSKYLNLVEESTLHDRCPMEIMDVMDESKPFCFVDVDGTLITEGYLNRCVVFLAKNGLFDPSYLDKLKSLNENYLIGQDEKNRKIDYKDYAHHALLFAGKGLEGKSIDDVGSAIGEYVNSGRGNILESTPRLAEILDERYNVIGMTGAPCIVLEPLFNCLGINAVFTYGTIFEIDENGLFTGKIPAIMSTGDSKRHIPMIKHKIAKVYLEAHPLKPSLAIGDSLSDPLGLTTQSIAFMAYDPSKTFRIKAKKKGWLICDPRGERKGQIPEDIVRYLDSYFPEMPNSGATSSLA